MKTLKRNTLYKLSVHASFYENKEGQTCVPLYVGDVILYLGFIDGLHQFITKNKVFYRKNITLLCKNLTVVIESKL